MLSNQTVCNVIRKNRLYQKTNCVYLTRFTVIDEADGICIKSRLLITFNQMTNSYYVTCGLRYGRCYIGPRKYGKQNCNDPEFVETISEKINARSLERYHLNKEKISARRRELYNEKKNKN